MESKALACASKIRTMVVNGSEYNEAWAACVSFVRSSACRSSSANWIERPRDIWWMRVGFAASLEGVWALRASCRVVSSRPIASCCSRTLPIDWSAASCLLFNLSCSARKDLILPALAMISVSTCKTCEAKVSKLRDWLWMRSSHE